MALSWTWAVCSLWTSGRRGPDSAWWLAYCCSCQTQLVKNSNHLFWMRQTEGASNHLPSLCWTVLPITSVFYWLFTKLIRKINLTSYKKKAFKMIQETKNKFWENISMSVKHKTESSSSEKSNQRKEHQSNENIIKFLCMWRYQIKYALSERLRQRFAFMMCLYNTVHYILQVFWSWLVRNSSIQTVLDLTLEK